MRLRDDYKLTTILSIIKNNGRCGHIDCQLCMLMEYNCMHRSIDYTYKRAVQWIIDTYGKDEAKAILMEALL